MNRLTEDGTAAGPIKWPVHVLRLEPSGDDGPPATAGRTNNDDEYGLDAGRTSLRQTPGADFQTRPSSARRLAPRSA